MGIIKAILFENESGASGVYSRPEATVLQYCWQDAGGPFRKGMRKLTPKSVLHLVSCAAIGVLTFVQAWPILAPTARAQGAAAAPSSGFSTQVEGTGTPHGTALDLSIEQAMWTAIAFEDVIQLTALMKYGIDPNKPEKLSQMTPLMAAETAEIVKVLLAAGAKPNLRDRIGRTALHHAVRMREASAVIRLLVSAGGGVNARAQDVGECTPLLMAIEHFMEEKDRREAAEAMRTLVALGADVDAVDTAGRTALAIAAASNDVELVRLLLQLGADPKRRLTNGRTPLDYAQAANAKDAAQVLANAPSKQPSAN